MCCWWFRETFITAAPAAGVTVQKSFFNSLNTLLYEMNQNHQSSKTLPYLISHDLHHYCHHPGITTEQISSYKYLWFALDGSLSFKLHRQQLVRKLKVELGFRVWDEKIQIFSTLTNIVLLLTVDQSPDELLRPPPPSCRDPLGADFTFVISKMNNLDVFVLLTYRFTLLLFCRRRCWSEVSPPF